MYKMAVHDKKYENRIYLEFTLIWNQHSSARYVWVEALDVVCIKSMSTEHSDRRLVKEKGERECWEIPVAWGRLSLSVDM